MYEIWLVLNIVWEIALGIWPWLAAAALLWAALLARSLRQRGARWRATLPVAAALAGAAAVAAFVALPGLTLSSLSQLDYWVDWANVAAIAAAAGGAVLAFTWPVLAARRSAP
ncbi:hypothetical protein [Ottowia sp.]|jgi:hypothetical protein|uniref:hypothetical protein n=1 Tax=Ottowia sp. TaxID=1898956 RepID=UPI0025E33A98|nr:hypothetical protein [Ottowia sp.]MBK6745605.1 hypothetical protein [Ottowia sp.]